MTAVEMLKNLRRNKNLYLISHRGNKKVWFAPDIPGTLPISKQETLEKTAEFSAPAGSFNSILDNIAGWMSYEHHLGPRISAATAFVLMSPTQKSKPSVEFTTRELSTVEWGNRGRLVYGLDDKYVAYFCAGVMQGLQTALRHPVADVKVEILNAVTDTVNSNLKSFEHLGQWLAEALVVELCKRSLIEKC